MRKKLAFLLFLIACVVAVSSCQANVNDNPSAEDVVCNHVFGEWITVKQANCKEDGLLLRTCTKCSETEGTNIAKNNIHTTVIDKAIDATCTTDGKTEGAHCSVCGIVLVAQNTIPAHHTFSEWQVKILPKYAYDGIEERVCECGITEERTMTKLEIDFSSYVFDNTKEYEIEFWVKNDANIAQKNVWIDAVKSFNKLYPNITIKLKHYTDNSRIYSDLIVQNEKPDAVLIKPSYIFDMNNSFDLISLNNLIADLNCGIEYGEDEIFKHLLDLTCIDGNFFAVPFMHSSQICYINKTYVEKLGYEIPDVLTWNFILEVSSAAIKKDSESGLYEINNGKTMIPISCKNPSDLLLGLLNENGVNSIFDKENSEFNDTARQVFSYIEDMISKGLLTTFAQSGYPSNLFAEGKCIFAFDSSAGSTWFGTDAPNSDVLERIDFKTVVRNIPCKSFQNLINYEQGLYFCAINNNNADKIFATWLFTKFLLSEDVQIAFSQTEGYLPSSSAIISSERFKEYITKSGLNNSLYYEVKIDSLKELQESIFNSKLCHKKTEDIYSWLINTICRDVERGKILDDAYYQNLFETLKNLYKI